MGKTLDPTTISHVREIIDHKVQLGTVPPVVYFAVNADGEVILSHASGKRGIDSHEEMTEDTVFWVASFTKLLTTIACMQLVEQGKLRLDDGEQVANLAPEIAQFKVLRRDGTGGLQLDKQKRSITLRMLLTHTSGFGYAFDDPKLRDWSLPIGIDDFSADMSELLRHQLVNQPGEAFQYGVGLDWAGILLERCTGTTLDDYIQENIVQPLGLKDISFLPSKSMKSRLAYMHQRERDGKLRQTEHINRRPLLARTEAEKQRIFHMGGCGCFASPKEYTQIIATLLNNGFNKRAGVRLLKVETVQAIFQDQIPDMPIYIYEPWVVAKPLLANNSPIIPPPENVNPHVETMGWGLSFALLHQPSTTGRAAGTAWWEGLPNLYWFADRKNGLGGVIATQVLPYGDIEVVRLSEEIERIVYAAYVRGG